MSGIAGIYHLDGRPVGEELERMIDAMEHRGPDGANTWRDGSIGLGHLMLETTPEDQYESLPLVDRTGNFAITADARIDNRDELIRNLDLREPEDRPITDTELILAAYKRWGRDCPKKLLGAFAFAVWDARERTLMLARDHFGINPIYYSKQENLFAFSSDIEPLLEYKNNSKINDRKVGDYISNTVHDKKYTFYTKIERLPPSFFIYIENKTIKKERYWEIDLSSELKMSSDEEYASAFMDIFTDAVKCRMRSSSPVSGFLSGGLDSSIVCSVASTLAEDEEERAELRSFSLIYDEFPDCDESYYIRKVLNEREINGTFINGNENKAISTSKELMGKAGPFHGPNVGSSLRLYEAVEEGGRVVLDGHGGDEVVSHGYGRLRELAREGRWIQLFRGLKGLTAGKSDQSPFALTLGFASKFGGKYPSGWKSWVERIGRYATGVGYRFLREDKNSTEEEISWKDVIDETFLEAHDFEARRREFKEKRRNPDGIKTCPGRVRHLGILKSSLNTHAFEVLDRASALCGVEARYPFWDKRLVQFCLSLPSNQRLRNGWGRFVARKSANDLLPDEVVWRKDKTDFINNFREGFLSERDLMKNILEEGSYTAEKYLDMKAVKGLFEKVDASSSTSLLPRELFLAWRVVLLITWLKNVSNSVGR